MTTATTSFTPASTSLTGGATYYWEVQALAPAGGGQNGPWSAVSSFTTAPSDFALSASPSSLTVAPGTGGTAAVTLTPINNFSATPNFTCSVSGTLGGVTCAVGTYGNNAVAVTITASSTARIVPSLPPTAPFGRWWLLVAALLLCGWSVDVGRRAGRGAGFRTLSRLGLVVVLAAWLAVGLSCGGGSGGGGGGTSPQPESGTVTVTGTAGSTSHTASIAVSVS